MEVHGNDCGIFMIIRRRLKILNTKGVFTQVNNNFSFHIQQSQQAEPPVFLCVLTQSPEERCATPARLLCCPRHVDAARRTQRIEPVSPEQILNSSITCATETPT
ncbi:unnamed protein product [Boreogadus saida]